MQRITNDYRDAKVLNLGNGSEKGPYLVTQTGVAPTDAIPKTKMFLLRPDGKWADLNAYVCQGKPEVLDDIVFTSMTQVMSTFGKLPGRPQVVELPVDEAGLQQWIDKQEGRDALQAARDWAAQYRARHAKK